MPLDIDHLKLANCGRVLNRIVKVKLALGGVAGAFGFGDCSLRLCNCSIGFAKACPGGAIIDQGVSDTFQPEQYEDDVRKRALNKIQQKV